MAEGDEGMEVMVYKAQIEKEKLELERERQKLKSKKERLQRLKELKDETSRKLASMEELSKVDESSVVEKEKEAELRIKEGLERAEKERTTMMTDVSDLFLKIEELKKLSEQRELEHQLKIEKLKHEANEKALRELEEKRREMERREKEEEERLKNKASHMLEDFEESMSKEKQRIESEFERLMREKEEKEKKLQRRLNKVNAVPKDEKDEMERKAREPSKQLVEQVVTSADDDSADGASKPDWVKKLNEHGANAKTLRMQINTKNPDVLNFREKLLKYMGDKPAA